MPQPVPFGAPGVDRVQDVRGRQLGVQRVDLVDLHPAAGGAGEEVLRAAADRAGGEVGPLAPAAVVGAPQVDLRVVAAEHAEGRVLVHDLEAHPLAVEGRRRRDVADGQRGHGRREPHVGSSLR